MRSFKIDRLLTPGRMRSINDNNEDIVQVLLVDDLPFNLLALEIILNDQLKIKWDKAFSGEDAIEKVKERLHKHSWRSYKVIIMDYYMPPGMNGSEATISIKKLLDEHFEQSYIVCLTAQKLGDFNFDNDMVVFDEVYQKPISTEQLKSIFQNAEKSMRASIKWMPNIVHLGI